ncbi:MAG: hypothetical protein JWQ16_1512 [Novosphingobium sp.]|nr:hypothetical protein [Novosphingobium sp.]
MTIETALVAIPGSAAHDFADDSAEPAPPAQILPQFAPVPRAMKRHNGWKPEVQLAFIEALAETGSVKAACRQVKRSDHGAYLLRRHPDAEEFRRAWDAALDIGLRRIEDVAMDRALHGHEQPVYSYGKLVGSRTVFNDRLLMFMLRNRAPERFGAGLNRGAGAKGNNAIDEMKLARLKKQWQKEYAAQIATKSLKRSEDVIETINAKLERMRESWLAEMSPRVRTLYEAYQDAERTEAEVRALPPMPVLPGLFLLDSYRDDGLDYDEANHAQGEGAQAGQ